MNKVNKTYKFRIYPNAEQEQNLSRHFGHSRFVYNYFLNQRKEQYLEDKKSDNYYAQCASLTKLKKQEGTEWLKEVNSQTLQFALKSLDSAYTNFFRGNAKFPRFKSRRSKNSFTVPQSGKIVDGKLNIPKFKDGIKIKLHREVLGTIGKMSITRRSSGKYFVSIFTEQKIEQMPSNTKAIGCDLGIKDFVITSDNKKFKNNRYTKKYAKKLKKAQQHLSRKQKGSNGFEKQKLKVAKIHEKIANSRLDTLHKVSYALVRDNGLMVIEDLNVKGMIKNRKLSKHIADASWGNFVNLLQYKCDWYGRELVKVNRFFPSSKTCNECGWINQDLNLSIREWTCKNGHKLDRDLNASQNILKEGFKIYREELAITKVERKSDFGNKAHSMKPEAQPIGSAVGG
ncbi:MAG TPA: IS200/IS605 family element RNA-guided endonuclease TnpB [Flavobacteriaceae bacterium]|nr:IS200/IS605 family element RNA-guided endonuclease TnpB [Flavobacteriaceae bacterium]